MIGASSYSIVVVVQKVFAGSKKVIVGSTKVIVRSTKVIVGSTKVIVGSTKVVVRSTRMIVGSAKVIVLVIIFMEFLVLQWFRCDPLSPGQTKCWRNHHFLMTSQDCDDRAVIFLSEKVYA